MLNSGIYKISCSTNDSYYYGSAKNFDSRWIKHKSKLNTNTHSNKHLQNMWNKYGKDAFKFEIDMLCPIEKLKQVEQVYLDIYVGRPECMNINKLVSGVKFPLTEEQQENCRINGRKFISHTPENIEVIRAASTGRIQTDAKRKKNSDITRAQWANPDSRNKKLAGMRKNKLEYQNEQT